MTKHQFVGLSEQEAASRLAKEGPNELPSSKSRSTLKIAIDAMSEPMFLLLVAIGVLYLLWGDLRESLALLVAVFLIIGITLYQESKAERALEALRDLSSPSALVIRGGTERRIPGHEVVTGDLVILSEGDRVPADAVLVATAGITTDESLLTGESAPVRYSGSLVVQGRGYAKVMATGKSTELGRIGKALEGTALQSGLPSARLSSWGWCSISCSYQGCSNSLPCMLWTSVFASAQPHGESSWLTPGNLENVGRQNDGETTQVPGPLTPSFFPTLIEVVRSKRGRKSGYIR